MKKDRFKVIIIACIVAIPYSAFRLYQRREGDFLMQDFLTLGILVVLMMVVLIYLKKNKVK